MTNPHTEDSRPLPPGWKLARLGDLCDSISTTDPRKEPDKKFTYIDISSIDRQSKSIVSPSVKSGKDAPTRARRIVRKGDVLVATTRPNLNAVALVGEEYDGQVCSTGLCVLRPLPECLDPEWAYFATIRSDFVDSLSGAVTGAMYPAVSDKRVYEQTIPLPPLSEQQRIVAVLNQQMAVVEGARKAAESRLEAAQALGQAFLRAVFPVEGQELPQDWKWERLEDVCEITLGQSPPGSTYRNQPCGLPFFQGKADFGDLHPTPTTWCVAPKKVAEVGDILISVRAPVGPTNIANVKCCIGRGLASLRCRKDVHRDFMLLGLKLYETDLATQGSGSTFAAITGSQLRAFEMPLPLLFSEQKRIFEILNQQLAAAERARKAAQAQLAEIEALPSTLLRVAFSAEL